MAEINVTFYDKELFKMLKQAKKAALDLSPVFREIQLSWYKGNRAIFSLKGPGQYEDLTPDGGYNPDSDYKKAKKKKWGFVYPILKASGKLERSLTQMDDINSVSKQYMVVGTSVDYAGFLQSGTKYMPARPPVLAGPEVVTPTALKSRQQIWVQMISNYIAWSLGIKKADDIKA